MGLEDLSCRCRASHVAKRKFAIYSCCMTPKLFLLLNLAFGFYNVGTIWAHEVDIFRTWKLVEAKSFHQVQYMHWHKLAYWVFIPGEQATPRSIY